MTTNEPGANPELPEVSKVSEVPEVTEAINSSKQSAAAPAQQPRNPLHGVTLEAIVTALADHHGWAGLGKRIPVRCFNVDPSVASSLRFLRKTPWAREKVEQLYLVMQRNRQRTTHRRG